MADAVLTGVKITPLGDRVLVRPSEKEEARRSGIIIPDTAKEKPQEGKVIATGKGKVSEDGKVLPMDVKAGDTVLFGKYSGTEIKIDDVDHLILHQDDILGIVSK
jgi:chaperonin GroES